MARGPPGATRALAKWLQFKSEGSRVGISQPAEQPIDWPPSRAGWVVCRYEQARLGVLKAERRDGWSTVHVGGNEDARWGGPLERALD
jgi:hypothetical protein